MEIRELMTSIYATQIRRGTIEDNTEIDEFVNKIKEEAGELVEASYIVDDTTDLLTECWDVIFCTMNLMSHIETDKRILEVMDYVIKKNELRADYGVK